MSKIDAAIAALVAAASDEAVAHFQLGEDDLASERPAAEEQVRAAFQALGDLLGRYAAHVLTNEGADFLDPFYVGGDALITEAEAERIRGLAKRYDDGRRRYE